LTNNSSTQIINKHSSYMISSHTALISSYCNQCRSAHASLLVRFLYLHPIFSQNIRLCSKISIQFSFLAPFLYSVHGHCRTNCCCFATIYVEWLIKKRTFISVQTQIPHMKDVEQVKYNKKSITPFKLITDMNSGLCEKFRYGAH
jgi:hypothetical protein